MEQSEQVVSSAGRGGRINVCRIILWVLFVVLGGACLWIWWTLGRLQEAVERQESGARPAATAAIKAGSVSVPLPEKNSEALEQ